MHCKERQRKKYQPGRKEVVDTTFLTTEMNTEL